MAKRTTRKATPAQVKAYNAFKQYNGQVYTGMQIGRGHTWDYDPGQWKETKRTPDLWTIHFAVTKRRRGHAPEGSGVPVGTEYNWYILAQQVVRKLDANDYSTELTGLKFKLAHKRAGKGAWSVTENGQRNRLINFLEKVLVDLRKGVMPADQVPDKAKVAPPKAAPAKAPAPERPTRVRAQRPRPVTTRKKRRSLAVA